MFSDFELRAWPDVSHHRRGAAGGAVAPAPGRPTSRWRSSHPVGDHHDAARRQRQHLQRVRAQRRSGPASRASFSTTRRRSDKRLKMTVGIAERPRWARRARRKRASWGQKRSLLFRLMVSEPELWPRLAPRGRGAFSPGLRGPLLLTILHGEFSPFPAHASPSNS